MKNISDIYFLNNTYSLISTYVESQIKIKNDVSCNQDITFICIKNNSIHGKILKFKSNLTIF